MKLSIITRKIIYKILSIYRNKEIGAFVLCYHSISNNKWRFSVSKDIFTTQFEYLMYKYQPLSMQDVIAIIDGKYSKPNNPAFLLTFDDGYKDILSLRDLIKSKKIKPVLFLLSEEAIASKNELGNSLEFLSKEDVLSLIDDGWEIGSHSATHKDFWKLSQEEIQSEIVKSKKTLELKYGVEVKYFSYPRGRYNADIINAVKSAGYLAAVTMDDGKISSLTDRYLIPRIGVDKTHGYDEFKLIMLDPVVRFRQFVKTACGGYFKKYL